MHTIDINFFITTLWAGANCKCILLVSLHISCRWGYQAGSDKVYTQGQLKLTHRNFTILNSHVTVIYLAERFMKNKKKEKEKKKKKNWRLISTCWKIWKCFGFWERIWKKAIITYPQATLLKIVIWSMTFGLKFICNVWMKNFLISKKLHSDNNFQLQQMYSCEVLGKGVCIARMNTGRNYIYNIIQS